jgi:MoxR-like ATPase
MLAELHAALHACRHKRFVLLAGLSGTGKTSIARAYSEAYCAALGLHDWQRHYAQVAVRPDWMDPTSILGFLNALVDPPIFQAGEALDLILRADQDRSHPYFLCLDEMNLARVEHYFAPFLSSMESAGGSLTIHGELDAVDGIEPRIPWPKNLFIFGTVNMDESTHPFSDKVLDRAFTFEIWDVDLEAWRQKKQGSGADPAILAQVAPVLVQVYDALRPARRHFGYRSADEILGICHSGPTHLGAGYLLDGAILRKILPRIRGDDSGPLKTALDELARVLPSSSFPRSFARIAEMRKALEQTGQARFWS